ncbi:MAG: serine/threonine-protein kinase, partial [Myxococcota bacterium]
MSSPADPFTLIGSTLADKYRVDRLIGEGGFGVVYAGYHLLLGQPVAIKCMKPSSGDAAEQQRVTDLFLREARVLFGLTHPNIVRMYDVATLPMRAPLPSGAFAPQVPYVVLELIEGRSLQAEVANRRAQGGPHFAAAELSGIFHPILEAIGFAHGHGVVHRDLKPSNVMLVGPPTGGTVKVVDFGIARVA